MDREMDRWTDEGETTGPPEQRSNKEARKSINRLLQKDLSPKSAKNKTWRQVSQTKDI